MRPFPLLLTLALVVPTVLAASEESGVVPLGTGEPRVLGVDHRRHAGPFEAVGVALREVTTQQACVGGCKVLFALLDPCPPGMACTQELRPPCVAVYAPAGQVATAYRFAWALDADDATISFSDMPRYAPATPSC